MTDAAYAEDPELVELDANALEEPVSAKPDTLRRLMELAQYDGNLCDLLEPQDLSKLGSDVVSDWKRDDDSRAEWKAKVKEALSNAAQEPGEAKDHPWPTASNVKHPILTVASQQFAARAYPAIVKGDEAVRVKVFGSEPEMPPGLEEAAQKLVGAMEQGGGDPAMVQQAQGLMAQVQAHQEAKQKYEGKRRRAERVKTFLNYVLFYGMDDWEGDTDALLHNIPIAGTAFRKVYYDHNTGHSCSEFVNSLRLTIPMESQALNRCPRITQDFDLYPYEITAKQRSGVYREVTLLSDGEDDQASRVILEQHRLHDLDGDGVEEPYVVTVDEATSEVLRIDASFAISDVEMDPNEGKVLSIKRWVPFVKYVFLPDPKGRAYGIGFGHLLGPLSDVINTTINQLLDAGHAQVAGGGFIASGLRLQGAGQTNTLRFKPGEYKTVQMAGSDLRNAIVERALPQPSPVLFQLLDLVLGAAKDIASIKDVLTGDAPSTAPVGTTLALIDQGLSSYTSIYKRMYRALREEFQLLYECERRHGDPELYAEVLDDPEAQFEQDFAGDGKDILPVSDPTAVTKMQAIAKAQALQPFLGQPYANSEPIFLEILRAIDVDNPEGMVAKAPGPNPMAEAEVKLKDAQASKAKAGAVKDIASATEIQMRSGNGPDQGGVPGLEGPPGDGMGPDGGQGGLAGPAGGMGAAVMGAG